MSFTVTCNYCGEIFDNLLEFENHARTHDLVRITEQDEEKMEWFGEPVEFPES